MGKDIWKYFGVTPIAPEKARVYGIDFGAGEMTACYIVNRDEIDLRKLSEDLYTDNNNSRYMYTIYSDKKNSVGPDILSNPEDIYTNIKTTPENAKSNYGNEQGVHLEGEKALTYQYLQEKTFCCFIREILQYNGRTLNAPESEVYLFVGRPSSNIWEEQAKNYQNILKHGLSELKSVKLPDKGEVKVNFHIIVYSEAEAAMAYEYKKGNIKPNETILIIDGGSSTFDCVVVKDGEVINEYSRQVGAGMIEQNLFDICILGGETAGQNVLKRKAAHDKVMKPVNPLDNGEGFYTVKLRQIKEDFYGSKGNDEWPGVLPLRYQGKPDKKIIDSEMMDIAINKMPVRVERSYQDEADRFGGNVSQEYRSFREAVEVFFNGAKARCFDRKTGEKVAPDRIILTGGATIMPFIQEIVKNVFEVEKNGIELEPPGVDRHYSVSNGLAYMGYVELAKRHELNKLKSSAHKKLEEIKKDVDSSVWNSCTNKLWQECYIEQIGEWVSNPSAKKIQNWVDIHYSLPIDAVRKDLGTLLEEKKVIEQINGILDAHFHQLFPQKGLQYQYRIQTEDILTAFSGQLQSINVSLWNMLGTGQKVAKVLSFLGFRNININTELTQEEKRKIQSSIRDNKFAILEDLKTQVIEKTKEAREQIYNTMLHNIDKSLEAYMEDLTPYFVKGGQ